jgi:hypothetical protein
LVIVSWIEQALDLLEKSPVCGYAPHTSQASEPTALAALALAGHGRLDAAKTATQWLRSIQNRDGSVGVTKDQPTPGWPTSLAMLAWAAADPDEALALERAITWALDARGIPMTKTPDVGHNTTLVAWSWCERTHSWIEPTSLFVLALKALGKAEEPRTREGVELLFDRLLPGGGCNYGNTTVLGQVLLPHIQPSGVILLALAGETDAPGKVAKTLSYLRGALSEATATTSLCWGILGLSAFRRFPDDAPAWLAKSAGRQLNGSPSPHKLALLLLAALGERSPLITLSLSLR